MIRIKVVKASHLLLAVAVVLVLIAVLALAGRTLFFPAETAGAGTSLVTGQTGEAVFASSFLVFDNALPQDAMEESSGAPGMESPLPLAEIPAEDMPRVLIYHTHTHEAYAQVEGDEYTETGAWRTADSGHSVVRVGEELAAILELYGFQVVHDTTDNEWPDFNTAYSRSLETVLAHGEPFDLYIDLHRDAYSSGEARTATVNGQEVARLMLLVGTGGGFSEKPDFEGNYAFACALTEALNEKHPGLCRDVMVKNNRYNQHVGSPAVLIEVGHNENTLAEALATMPYLAEGLAGLLLAQ